MRPRLLLSLLTALALSAALLPAATVAAQARPCHPFTTEPRFRGTVPTASEAIGVELGSRDVTTAESDAYLQAVDDASTRVITGTAGHSQQGRPLRYAIVGRSRNVTRSRLASIRDDVRALRAPTTSPARAARIARRSPAILWVASNVHDGEESGTDASLQVLYELADRSDCAARRILDNAIVVLLPIQNPDGREADTRRNAYGFDMNRDWFARTQPETDGKIELLRRYPPVLFIDAHEMGADDYFFPPNADPVYHEITDESVDWINNLYGAEMAAEFNRQGIPFFNRSIYDLFYMGYGDTVPSTGFIAAGMTFEKNNEDPTSERVYEQYVTQWTSLSAAARNKEAILNGWSRAHAEAFAQGRAGRLEPNEIVNPGNEVVTQVPDERVRHYFLRNDNPDRAAEVQRTVRRLQRMDVRVRQLTAPLRVPDYRPYAEDARSQRLPAGTYWIKMAQRQKHWVQAMLNEDTYTPFPYFYDVTAWSLPLLADIDGGRSGALLRPSAQRVPKLAEPDSPALPEDGPRIGVFQLSLESSSAIESSGWLRWLLTERWGADFVDTDATGIRDGALDDIDVLLVPNGPALDAAADLGVNGLTAIRDWVHVGGRYVGWRGGTQLAALARVSSVHLSEPTSDVPGSLFHSRVNTASPLATGVGDDVWNFYAYDLVMRPAEAEQAVVTYPPADADDFFVSGFADGEEELGSTAALVDEPVGEGRSIVFATEPNFRGFTDGTQTLLFNALFGDDPAAATTVRSGTAARRAAAKQARRLDRQPEAIRVSVAPSDAAAAEAVLSATAQRCGVAVHPARSRSPSPTPVDWPPEHPFATAIPRDLRCSGVNVEVFSAP